VGAYVELASVRAALGEQAPDRDDLIVDSIAAAEQMIDDFTGRTFSLASSTSARTYRPGLAISRDGHRVWVDDIGTASGLVVETGTAAGWTVTTDYEAGPLNALALGRPVEWLTRPSGSLWPAGAVDRVRVTARWGWPTVPAPITQAARLLAARLYRRKDSPEGVVGSADFGAVRVSRVDPDVMALLARYATARVG
jgi:hypothetical protein